MEEVLAFLLVVMSGLFESGDVQSRSVEGRLLCLLLLLGLGGSLAVWKLVELLLFVAHHLHWR